MTVQSFLIATFGFSYQKKAELLSKSILEPTSQYSDYRVFIFQFNLYLVSLAAVGLFSSQRGLASVNAAVNAIKKLDDDWAKLLAKHKQLAACEFPLLTGGGSASARDDGIRLANALPRFFWWFWVSILILSPAVAIQDWKLVLPGKTSSAHQGIGTQSGAPIVSTSASSPSPS